MPFPSQSSRSQGSKSSSVLALDEWSVLLWVKFYLNWLKYIEILYIRIYYVENYWNILKYHSMEIHGNTIQCSGGYSMVSFLKPRYCTTVAGNICTACWHLHPLASRLVGWHNKWPGNSTCTTVRILSNSLHQYHWMSSDNTSLGLWNSFAIHVFRHVFRSWPPLCWHALACLSRLASRCLATCWSQRFKGERAKSCASWLLNRLLCELHNWSARFGLHWFTNTTLRRCFMKGTVKLQTILSLSGHRQKGSPSHLASQRQILVSKKIFNLETFQYKIDCFS